MSIRRLAICAGMAGALALLPAAGRADEISDAIAEAARAYAARDIAAARAALAEASQLLQQRTADSLAAALPAPLPGWTAEDAEGRAAGAALFGGLTQASRTYRNAAGQEVRLEVMADNPMIAQLSMMMTNPAMAGAMGRLIRIGPHRAIQGNDGQLMMLLKNRFLVQVGGDAPLDAKIAYAQRVDAARLPD